MNIISDLSDADIKGKYVLVRAGLDVPLDAHGDVADRFRVRRAVETLAYLSERGARTIILSHIGRDPAETNEPVARSLKEHIPVSYVPDILGAAAHSAREAMQDGDVLLLENLRRDPRETKNDPSFAESLATLGDIYVNDAFSAAHRAHASIVGVPAHLPSYAGLLLAEEVKQLNAARDPEKPSFAILGGAKFETKAPLIRTLLKTYDHVFITGALANDVFKAQGFPVGRSLISEEQPGDDVLSHPRFLSPVDVTVERSDMQARVKKPGDVEPGDKIVDIGPDTIAALSPVVSKAKFIIWNGPTGLYEDGYTHYTQAVAELLAQNPDAHRIIGGGDTIALLQKSGFTEESLGFFSTGGGAMLEYLLKGTLPAIEALG